MNELSPATTAAATVGILGSAWAAGQIYSISNFTIPGLLAAPIASQHLAMQWRTIFEAGKSQMPKVAVAALIGYAYLAYDRQSHSRAWAGFLAAGALTVAVVPFTLLFMSPTNNALIDIATGLAGEASDEATRAFLLKWTGLNTLRSSLPLAGAILGSWTLLG